MLRRLTPLVVGAGLGLGMAIAAFAQTNPTPNQNCSPTVVPTGQANPPGEPEPLDPVWCFNLTQEPTTRITGFNDWIDEFQTNVQMGRLNDGDMGYRIFDNVHGSLDPKNHTLHFINNNHWMTDMAGSGTNGDTLRPNRSFTFENGKLIVEADVAAGIADYSLNSGEVWPEIDFSMAPNPTGVIVDSLYNYGAFGGFWTVGCRLHSLGSMICAVESGNQNITTTNENRSNCYAAGPSRVLEISGFELCGTTHLGGDRVGDNANYFRVCDHNQMDMFCRDRFRFELTKSSLTVYVNGHLYFQDAGWPPERQLPDSMVNGGQVYIYFGEFRGILAEAAYRFHWQRLAVNPHNQDGTFATPSAAPSFCLGMPQNTCDMGPMPGMGSPTATPGVIIASPTATRVSGNSTPAPTTVVVSSPAPVGNTGGGGGGSGSGSGGSGGGRGGGGGGGSSSPSTGSSGGGSGGGSVAAFIPQPVVLQSVSSPPATLSPTATPQTSSTPVEVPAMTTLLEAVVTATDGGQLANDTVSVTVPPDAVGPLGAKLNLLMLDPSSLPPPAAGFQLGANAFLVTLTDLTTNQQLAKVPSPLTLEYRLSADEISAAGNDLTRVKLATLVSNNWIALDCTSSGAAVDCPVPHLSLFALIVAPTPVGPLDTQLDNGWFYRETNGFGGAGDSGFSVLDDADASFWTELQRLGGVDQLGYPISQRFVADGYITQAFQRAALQWRPELSQAAPLNLSDVLSAHGADAWLDINHAVPPAPADIPSEDVALSLLDPYPALRAFYDDNPQSSTAYGRPVAIKNYGPFVVVRFQYGILQLLTTDSAAGPAGTIVVGNSGDLAKEVGVWPSEVVTPTGPPPAAVAPAGP